MNPILTSSPTIKQPEEDSCLGVQLLQPLRLWFPTYSSSLQLVSRRMSKYLLSLNWQRDYTLEVDRMIYSHLRRSPLCTPKFLDLWRCVDEPKPLMTRKIVKASWEMPRKMTIRPRLTVTSAYWLLTFPTRRKLPSSLRLANFFDHEDGQFCSLFELTTRVLLTTVGVVDVKTGTGDTCIFFFITFMSWRTLP